MGKLAFAGVWAQTVSGTISRAAVSSFQPCGEDLALLPSELVSFPRGEAGH